VRAALTTINASDPAVSKWVALHLDFWLYLRWQLFYF